MLHNFAFGPAAQTPAQRALVLLRMQQALPHLRKALSPQVQQLHARYVAGELTWSQVYEALDESLTPGSVV